MFQFIRILTIYLIYIYVQRKSLIMLFIFGMESSVWNKDLLLIFLKHIQQWKGQRRSKICKFQFYHCFSKDLEDKRIFLLLLYINHQTLYKKQRRQRRRIVKIKDYNSKCLCCCVFHHNSIVCDYNLKWFFVLYMVLRCSLFCYNLSYT